MPRLTSVEKAAFDALDKWLDFRTRFGGLAGLQASIRRKGALVFSRAYGYADEPAREKYTVKHAGHIASHSKMFTSCLALQLQAAGALNILDPAVTHLPWLKQHRDKRVRDITLRDLMSNRSGIFRDGLDATFWELEKSFLSPAQLQDEVLAAKLVYDPNTETKYSNIGVSLLGLALESASGKSYDALARERILDKLPGALLMTDYGMKKNVTYAAGHSRKLYNGARRVFRHAKAEGMASATGYCGNTEATSLFLHELYFGQKLLPVALQREMMHLSWPVRNLSTEFYGLGTMFGLAGGHTYMGHSGGYPGFSSQTRHKRDSDYIFSCILNSNEVIAFNIIRTMADLLKKIGETFGDKEKIDVTPPMLNKWSAIIYVVGAKKALALPVETWTPVDECFLAEKRGGAFYPDKAGGYMSVGEPVRFIRSRGHVAAVKFGAHTSHDPAEFLRRSKKAMR